MSATEIVTEIPGPRAQRIVERDTNVFAPCSGRAYPFVIDRGQGCYVWDVDGNRYLDMNAGLAVNLAGHSHPRIIQAIQRQLTKFIHMAGTDFYNEPMVRLCEKLIGLMPVTSARGQPPRRDWQVFLCNSGTEAVEAAIKLARYASGRQAIISFFGSFHGRSYGSLSLTAYKSNYRQGFAPLVPGTFQALYPNPYRPPLDMAPERVVELCLGYIEQTLFGTVVPPNEVAAIIVEPILGEGGYVVPPSGFLSGLRALCDRHGIALIADEIQSGVGRTGKMWAFEHEGVVPDIVTTAKGLGGGLPLGALVAQTELAQRWKPGAHGNTYGGNGLASVAGYEALSLVEEELSENAAQVGEYLKSRLEELGRRYEQIGEVRGRGLMLGVEFVRDRETKEPAAELAARIMEASFKRGLLTLMCGVSTIRFCPPLILSEEQADEAIDIFEAAMRAAM